MVFMTLDWLIVCQYLWSENIVLKQAIAKKRITYRNMKHLNAHDFLSTLNDFPWDPFLFFYDINDVVDAWEYL